MLLRGGAATSDPYTCTCWGTLIGRREPADRPNPTGATTPRKRHFPALGSEQSSAVLAPALRHLKGVPMGRAAPMSISECLNMEMHTETRPCEEMRLRFIHEAALEAFVREGYAGASMASIARAVGGSKTTLYSRYPSKTALFLAVVRFELDHFFETIARFPSPEPDMEAALHKHCVEFANAAQSVRTRNVFRLVIGECHRLPEVQRDYSMRVAKHLAALSTAIEASVRKSSGMTLDRHVVAKLVFNLDMNFLYQQLQDLGTTHADSSCLEEHARIVLGILLPPLTKTQQR